MTTTETGVQNVNAMTLKGWLDKGEAVLIDVREPDEHKAERIEGARLMPLSAFNPSEALNAKNGAKLVLHCRSGRRSEDAGKQLLGAGASDALHLEGGIEAWKQAGMPVVRSGGTRVSIMRQVQMVAGGCVLVGTLLGAFVNPWLLIIPGFFGAGLLFAGLSGTCGMAAMLGVMPWNK